MAPPNTQLWRMADRLADGHLAEIIAEQRTEGAGYEQISRRLYADHGIEVTRQTLYSWCANLEEVAA